MCTWVRSPVRASARVGLRAVTLIMDTTIDEWIGNCHSTVSYLACIHCVPLLSSFGACP